MRRYFAAHTEWRWWTWIRWFVLPVYVSSFSWAFGCMQVGRFWVGGCKNKENVNTLTKTDTHCVFLIHLFTHTHTTPHHTVAHHTYVIIVSVKNETARKNRLNPFKFYLKEPVKSIQISGESTWIWFYSNLNISETIFFTLYTSPTYRYQASYPRTDAGTRLHRLWVGSCILYNGMGVGRVKRVDAGF